MIPGILLAVFIVSVSVTALLVRYGNHIGITDTPNHRSLHTNETPRTGGIAIFLAMMAGVLLAWQQGWLVDNPFAITIATGLVAAIALIDDVRSLPAMIRLLVQLVACIVVIRVGLLPEAIQLPGLLISLPVWISWLLTMLFILWMTNLYNFMDGMDGFAGGMAVIGFGGMAILGGQAEHHAYFIINLIISTASAGFLYFNFPPARIFMGDFGASVLGFLAAIQILWADRLDIFPIWIGILVFSPFIVDATWTLFRRLLNGERLWDAHRSHFYQRLVLSGWGHQRTVIVEYILMLLVMLTAVLIVDAQVQIQVAAVCLWICIFAVLMSQVRKLEQRTSNQ